jgi:D-alanyl-lipoteichoic acid acyltransferase DltB (MBOAT superfamily)
MLFNSYIFIFIYLPLIILGFYGLNRWNKTRFSLAWLLGGSLFFYGFQNPFNLSLITLSILFNYSLAKNINHTKKETLNLNNSRYRKLIFGIVINLAILGYFKYIDFIFNTVNTILHTDLPLLHRELPLGISFFTFLQIAYLVDTYREKSDEKNWVNYALFVTFFPHLIAGPIVHHKALLCQFKDKSIYNFNVENFAIGITIFILGLSKKVLLADPIASYSSPVFQAASEGVPLNVLDAWGGALAYTLQLYFDFSGYSDMAVGLSKLFNISLPENFNSPYKSRSIIEFWRRWHITLSHFLRDYLYIPLGGNRLGEVRRYLNLMITMLLGGLWHGAGWTFVVWGGLHGLYLMINHGWLAFCQRQPSLKQVTVTKIWSFTSQLLTFGAVVISWVFFRARNLNDAFVILHSMFSVKDYFHAGQAMQYITLAGWLWIVGLLVIVWIAPNTQQLTAPFYSSTHTAHLTYSKPFSFSFLWAAGISLLTILCIINLSKASEFLYFSF